MGDNPTWHFGAGRCHLVPGSATLTTVGVGQCHFDRGWCQAVPLCPRLVPPTATLNILAKAVLMQLYQCLQHFSERFLTGTLVPVKILKINACDPVITGVSADFRLIFNLALRCHLDPRLVPCSATLTIRTQGSSQPHYNLGRLRSACLYS